jgi:leucyl-tRNA synthetase
MPHLAEEFWITTGGKGSVHKQKWPMILTEKLVDTVINLPIQVNGKVRGAIEISTDLSQIEVEERAAKSENVAKYLIGKSVIKVIYIKNKIINFLIRY